MDIHQTESLTTNFHTRTSAFLAMSPTLAYREGKIEIR
jgi:hypothetical protein